MRRATQPRYLCTEALRPGQGESRTGSDRHDSAASHNRLADCRWYRTCARLGRSGCRPALGAPGRQQGRPRPLPTYIQPRPEAYRTCSPALRDPLRRRTAWMPNALPEHNPPCRPAVCRRHQKRSPRRPAASSSGSVNSELARLWLARLQQWGAPAPEPGLPCTAANLSGGACGYVVDSFADRLRLPASQASSKAGKCFTFAYISTGATVNSKSSRVSPRMQVSSPSGCFFAEAGRGTLAQAARKG